MPPNTVYVGRPTDFGNPFVVGEYVPPNTFWLNGAYFPVETREHAMMLFTHWIMGTSPVGYTSAPTWPLIIKKRLPELVGKNLACWCPLNEPCHADVLIQLVTNP